MFISNVRTEFYDIISSNRVLLLVGCDVDAICACKILQYLFQCDNVLYTLIPVYGKLSLVDAFKQHKEQTKYVVMINCGATFDIVEAFEPDDDVVFFVSDSNRPVDVYNIYSESQICLLMRPDDIDDIPTYEDLFRDSDDEEDEEEETGRISESVLLKRREKRQWEDNRNKVMFDYSKISYIGSPSAMLMFDLAWKMSRDSNDLLWWSIVGLTEQYVLGKVEREKYLLNATSLLSHVSRHNRVDANNVHAVSCMKIAFDKELNLVLYRHWSLFESLKHSKYTACKFKLWSFKGQKKLLEFLAEIGLPLHQCKQKFSAMDMEFRANVCGWMEDLSEKYKLDKIVYGSFTSQYGFKGKFCAMDIVLAVNALLESIDKEKTQTDKFLDALDALSKGKVSSIQRGIELAKLQITAIFHHVQTFIDMNHIISAGSFLYAVIPDSTHDLRYFNYPGCLSMLAHFLLEAHVNSARSRKARLLPLVLLAPDEAEPDRCLVLGIPPLSEGSPKNFFGKAFEQAAEQSRVNVSQDLFYSSFIYINSNDKSRFFDSLILLLS